ncbi:hypothetical protein BB560_004788 [Smittium megazygosporum]|uniref:Uncharacterized protein n=1 Tax=Smittium megazygosporum TaxID=133381 RepID=A0A2T9Z897_9FUNG|nr:hypothetical protein BB560_004788 [Smittium megazygosporum]
MINFSQFIFLAIIFGFLYYLNSKGNEPISHKQDTPVVESLEKKSKNKSKKSKTTSNSGKSEKAFENSENRVKKESSKKTAAEKEKSNKTADKTLKKEKLKEKDTSKNVEEEKAKKENKSKKLDKKHSGPVALNPVDDPADNPSYSKVVENYYKNNTSKKDFDYEDSADITNLEPASNWVKIKTGKKAQVKKTKAAPIEVHAGKFSSLNPDQNLEQNDLISSSVNAAKAKSKSTTKNSTKKNTAQESKSEVVERSTAKNRRKSEKFKAQKQAVAQLQNVRLKEHKKELDKARMEQQFSKDSKRQSNISKHKLLPTGAMVENGRLVWT